MTCADEFPAFHNIATGQIDDLPTQVSNVVRIFISSTFTDTVEERNTLAKKVFPDLRRYCQGRGLDFEVVDMRWGVRDSATSDHLTSALCLREIDHCKRLSVGPSFVALLGDKYGYRPIPSSIPSEEFDKLMDLAKAKLASEDTGLLEDWFCQDNNAVPPIHVLQPITTKLKDYYNDQDLEKRQKDRDLWWEIFKNLQRVLRQAANFAVEEGVFTREQMHKYFFSVTEEEVRQGKPANSNDQSNNCLFFFRDIEGLQDHLDSPKTRKFLDMTDDGTIDVEAQTHLKNLKQDVVGETNVHKFTIPWSPDGIDPKIPEHSKYLDDFCDTFKHSLIDMIDKSLKSRSKVENQAVGQLYEEMLHHASFCAKKCSVFRGRQDILQGSKDFLVRHPCKPLVVHGVSGSGKTSVMAMVVKHGREWLGDSAVVLCRFLGTSAHSSSIQETLSSVCQQVCFAYGVDQPAQDKLEDFTKLVQLFRRLITSLPTSSKPLLLVLDSIDQLQSQNEAHSMHWLPKRFPEHTHIAISMLPKLFGCLDKLRETLTDEECYIEMKPIPSDTGMEIMDGWLEQKNRTLTSQQKEAVTTALQKCPQPLFLKLLFEDFVHWRSYDDPDTINLPTDVRNAITTLFEDLERKHGSILIAHALAYLTAAKNGRTQTELEDVLSCDDEVLNDVYQYWDPPVDTIVRIPASLWKRIHYDIEEFLVERQADGKTVVAWYHRQFWEAAQDRYLNSPDILKKRHELLARMFLGEFSEGTIRPITLLARGKAFDKADRQTSLQPLVFSNQGEDVFNLRKLQELPHHLAEASMQEILEDEVLFNFTWLLSKLRAFSFLELMSDFHITSKEIDVLQGMMNLASSNLKADPFTLSGQLIGRLNDHREGHPKLDKLLKQAKQWIDAKNMPIMIPRSTCLMQPGGPLRVTLAGHPSRVLKVMCTRSGKILISGCEDDKGHIMANVWDLHTFELIHTLQADNEIPKLKGHLTMAISCDDRSVFLGHRTVKMFDLNNGECVRQFETDNSIVYTDLKVGEDVLVAGCIEGKQVTAWNITDGKTMHLMELPEATPHVFLRMSTQIVAACSDGSLHVVDAKSKDNIWNLPKSVCGPITCALLTSDESQLITSHQDNAIRTWRIGLESNDPVMLLKKMHKKPVSKLMITPSGHLLSVSLDKTLRVWDLTNGNPMWIFGHDGLITCVASIPCKDDNLIVTGSKDDTLKIWDVVSGKLINTLEGHSSWISDVAAVTTSHGRLVTSACNDKTVKIWLPNQIMTSSLSRHECSPRCIVTTSSGQYVVTSAWQDITKIWNASDGRCMHDINIESTCLTVPPYNDNCVIGGNPNGQVHCWDLQNGQELWTLTAHTDAIAQLCWGPKDVLITAGGHDAKVWNVFESNLDKASPQVTFSGHEGEITALAVTKSTSNAIVVTGCDKGAVKIWAYTSGDCIQTVSHAQKIECLAISSTDKYFGSGSKDGAASVWSLESSDVGKEIRTKQLSKDSTICMVFTHDEEHLICGSHTGKKQLYMWDYLADDEGSSRFLEGHHHAVMVAKTTTNGEYLFTSSRDCTVRAWHLASGRQVASFDCQSQIKYLDFAEIGKDWCFVTAATKMAIVFLDVMLTIDAECSVPSVDQSSDQTLKKNGKPKMRRKMWRSSVCHVV